MENFPSIISNSYEKISEDLYLYQDDNDVIYLSSPNAEYDLPFQSTRASLLDVNTYKRFINKAVGLFRSSKEYKHYKSYLMGLGLDHCQIFGYLGEEELGNKGLEMHHCFLTIWDIAVLITEHVINTTGKITTFDLVDLLIHEHSVNHVPVTMLSKTAHQLYHSDSEQYIPPNMILGKWWMLLYKYRYGITMEIAKKVIAFCQEYLDNSNSRMSMRLKTDIGNYAQYNEYGAKDIMVYSPGDEFYFDPNNFQPPM